MAAKVAFNAEENKAYILNPENQKWEETRAYELPDGSIQAFDGSEYIELKASPMTLGEKVVRKTEMGARGFTDRALDTVTAIPELMEKGMKAIGIPETGIRVDPKAAYQSFAQTVSNPINKLLDTAGVDLGSDRLSEGDKIAYAGGQGAADAATFFVPAAAAAKAAQAAKSGLTTRELALLAGNSTNKNMTANAARLRQAANPQGSAGRRIVNTLADQKAMQTAAGITGGSVTEATDNPYAGLAASMAVPFATSAAFKIPTPNKLEGGRKKLVEDAKKFNIPLSAADQSGNKSSRTKSCSRFTRLIMLLRLCLGNGRVVTWGNADDGGDSSAVQGELKDQVVQQIYSTDSAFAAVLGNGRVVTWGDADYGGDSSAVQGELKDQVVQQIYSTGYAFAAVLGNGRVVTWGSADYGGDSSAVQGELKDQVVQQIYSTGFAFAAVLGNGRVVTWGSADYGGDSRAVQGELKDQVVQQIYSTGYAFAAVLGNGRVVTWGDADSGGDSSAVQGELKDQVVQQIYSTPKAFLALLGNGRMVKWGDNLPARVIQLPLGRTVIDVVGNSIILNGLYVVPVDNEEPSLEDSTAYKELLKGKTYNRVLKGKDGGGIKFNDEGMIIARRKVLQDRYITNYILSFLVKSFRGSKGSIPKPK